MKRRILPMQSEVDQLPDLDQIRSRVKGIGLEMVPEGSGTNEELQHYVTQLIFGITIRLHTIGSALKNQDLQQKRPVLEAQQSNALKELELCSDIFQALSRNVKTA
jgi:hypothetical protein